MRNGILPITASLVLAGLLSACHHKSEPLPATATASAPAALAGVLITGGHLVLPAVPGHPGAAYFTIVNQGHGDAVVTRVVIDGAGQSDMHETSGNAMLALPTLAIRGGGSVIFAPGGKHVMVFALAPRLVAGTTTQMTLIFNDGSKLSAPLSIEAAGGAPTGGMDDMAGMKM